MCIRAGVFFLVLAAACPILVAAPCPIWAIAQCEAEDGAETPKKISASAPPPWKHKFGLCVGVEQLFDGDYWSAIFYENQIDGHWVIRPSVERMRTTEYYYKGQGPIGVISSYEPVDVNRVGADVDCIYYPFRRRQNGTWLYLLAGLGLHSVKMRDDGTWDGRKMVYRESSGVAPALSVGLGWHFGRYFGMEYKRSFSTLDTPFPEDVGKNWDQYTLNFRFPVPGAPKGNWPPHRTKKSAEGTGTGEARPGAI